MSDGRQEFHRPLDALVTPRFAGLSTFLRLPLVSTPDGLDVAITGIPFDVGTSFRPGARFGPRAVRETALCFASTTACST